MPSSIEQSLERQHQRLEESLEKLKKALLHWRVSSAEYEALREELQTLPADATREDMLEVGAGFGGTIIDEAEVKALLGDRLGMKRTLDQTITAVGHRINYVQENVQRVEKQIKQGENKLASLSVVSEPDLKNEEGLPIIDIHEELDEDGNIISATVNGVDPESPKPLDTTPLNRFQKVMEGERGVTAETLGSNPPAGTPRKSDGSPEILSDKPPAGIRRDGDKKPITEALEGIKTISSRDEEGGGGFVRVVDNPKVQEGDFVREVPTDTPEEAEVRRQMLDYNLQEIGAVVAEINLEEGGIFYGHEDSEDDESDELDSEDEDRYGRAATRVITPEYQREMEELAQKIKERGEAARATEASMRQEEKQQPQNLKPKKKGVRFVEVPEISPPPPSFPDLPSLASAQNQEDAIPLLVDLLAIDAMRKSGVTAESGVPTKEQKPSIFRNARAKAGNEESQVPERVVSQPIINANVLERPLGNEGLAIEAPSPQPRKMSRFRAEGVASATQDHAADEDAAPPNAITSSFVVERHPPPSTPVEAPDELNPSTHRAEVAMEYHRLKNRMIQKQGGFVENEEEMAKVPLDENGEGQKVSRFMAARLRGIYP